MLSSERLTSSIWIKVLGICVVSVLGLCGVAIADDPEDPPSETDWSTFGVQDGTLYYRKDDTNYNDKVTLRVEITDTNPNHEEDHASVTVGETTTDVEHQHFEHDYGDEDYPTRLQGIEFWLWTYGGFTPQVLSCGNPTIVTNCVSYAYNGYKDANMKASTWVNSGTAANPYRTAVHEISPRTADNTDYATVAGDRCDHVEHVWIVTTGSSNGATVIEWKNNCSPIHHWYHDSGEGAFCSNDAPKAYYNVQTDDLYESGYGIYNKTDR